MSILLLIAATGCFITLHGPNGKDEMRVDSGSITIVRPVTPNIEPHIAAGSRTIVYVDGHKFGIHETVDEVEQMIDGCDK